MKYRITTQHLKSDNEQTIIKVTTKEDAKKLYIESAKNDYFSLLEQCRCGEWERVIFQIAQGNIEKELATIAKGVVMAKETGIRAEGLFPYAKNVYESMNANNKTSSITMRECFDITYYDFTIEVMKRFANSLEN